LQGENIVNEKIVLKRFSQLKCKKIKVGELDYSDIESDLTLDDLCNMVNEYASSINKIRTMDSDLPEFIAAYAKVLEFKKACNDYLCQNFKYINEILKVEIKKENSKIDLSSEYDMQKVKIGNTGEMYYINDLKSGKEYYFKPAVTKSGEKRDYRAYIQEAAYNVQKIINPEVAVKCNVTNINGIFGAIQEKINVDIVATERFIDYFENDVGELSPEMIEQILNEYLVDYVLCNYDAHASNFVIDENGALRGIDKEQSFRYINRDLQNDMLFSTNFNKQYGESETIYSTLLKVPDEQYRKLFMDYAYGKCNSNQEAELLLSRIVERKSHIVERIELLSEDITRKNLKSNVRNSVIDFAVSATEERTTNEQSKTIQEGMLSKCNISTVKQLEDK